MFIKIVDRSQLVLLRRLNAYLGDRKVPDAVLGLIHRILEDEKIGIHDYIALFLDPVKNDTVELYDDLCIFPYTLAHKDHDFDMEIKDRRNGERILWSGYGVEIKETGAKVYLIYAMRKKDVWRKNVL